MKYSFLLLIIALIIPRGLYPEIIYMKDGQILKGSIISEDKATITLKSRYQTRQIFREHIRRILYGDREMESINILLKNGTLLKGFLIDQDKTRVVFREERNSPREKTILKSNISQLSPEEILLLSPRVYVHTGYFFPFATGKTELSAGPLFMIGAGMNFIWVRNARVLLETGYTKSRGKENSDEYMEFIPVIAGIKYSIKFLYFNIVPKLGIGAGILQFNNGEGSSHRSYDLLTALGVGLVHEFHKTGLSAGLWGESIVMYEERAYKSVFLKAGIGYRF
jgi:sRNA-binding regulator protein Hfq